VITNLKFGESYQSEKFLITFTDLDQITKNNYTSFIGNFSIKDSNNTLDILKPELRIYNQPNIITSEADIKSSLLSDKFITMNTVQNEEYFNVRYQVKPFMVWIWISVLLIALGGLISLLKKKHEK
jgi:cytochrome c-type biogenesis protein CcmF